MKEICHDLTEEHSVLESVLLDLSEMQWNTPTPFYGWTIKDQVTHLTCFDRAAALSAAEPNRFRIETEALLKSADTHEEIHQRINAQAKGLAGEEVLARWNRARTEMVKAFANREPKDRLPWYERDLGARSSATARLMESWAHGQDIADALGIRHEPSLRLRHIAHLGVSTFAWSFLVHGLPVPDQTISITLSAPKKTTWKWGEDESEQSITGTAEDFCLVVTQRRHPNDTELTITGNVARQWMENAQAFAGAPERGPAPGERISLNVAGHKG